MDNIFKDLDYSDISTKYFQNKANNNKTFGEIEIKKGKFGLIKLIIFLILFLILIILIIVVISKNSNIKSLEQKIKENNEQLNTNKNILEEKNKKLSKFQEYLKFKKLNDNKNNENNIANPQNYELEIKTQEDQQTYDEFYKMNHNNKKLLGNNNKKRLSNNNNNFMENLPENSRIKKEREKMKGHKCELCQKFYDCLDENAADYLCQECSKHRTD